MTRLLSEARVVEALRARSHARDNRGAWPHTFNAGLLAAVETIHALPDEPVVGSCVHCQIGGTMIRDGVHGHGHYGHDGAWLGPCRLMEREPVVGVEELAKEIASSLRTEGWLYGNTYDGPVVDQIAAQAARVAIARLGQRTVDYEAAAEELEIQCDTMFVTDGVVDASKLDMRAIVDAVLGKAKP